MPDNLDKENCRGMDTPSKDDQNAMGKESMDAPEAVATKEDVKMAAEEEKASANKDAPDKEQAESLEEPAEGDKSVTPQPAEASESLEVIESHDVENDDDDDDDDDDEEEAMEAVLENDEEEDTDTKDDSADKDNETKDVEEPSSLPTRPIKRARTAYFIFADENRAAVQKAHPGGGVAVVGRALGQQWASLSADEKAVYQQKAAAERAAVAKAVAAAGDLPIPAAQPQLDPNTLVFPLARMRKITKLDPDVNNINKEALALITKATELALAHLGTEAVKVASIQNRRKLLPEDVVLVAQTRGAYGFLKEDLQDLVAVQQQQQQEAATAAGSKRKAADDAAASQSNKLTSYFSVKKSGDGSGGDQ